MGSTLTRRFNHVEFVALWERHGVAYDPRYLWN